MRVTLKFLDKQNWEFVTNTPNLKVLFSRRNIIPDEARGRNEQQQMVNMYVNYWLGKMIIAAIIILGFRYIELKFTTMVTDKEGGG